MLLCLNYHITNLSASLEISLPYQAVYYYLLDNPVSGPSFVPTVIAVLHSSNRRDNTPIMVCAKEMRECKTIDIVHTHITTLPIFLENQVTDYHEYSFQARQFQSDASCWVLHLVLIQSCKLVFSLLKHLETHPESTMPSPMVLLSDTRCVVRCHQSQSTSLKSSCLYHSDVKYIAMNMSDLFCILLTPPFHLYHHSSIPSPFCNTSAGLSLIWWHLSPGPQTNTAEYSVGLNRVQFHYPPSAVYSIPRHLRWDNTSCITIFAYCNL